MCIRDSINCEPTRKSITKALQKLYSHEFQVSLENTVNPYGEGGASEKIVSTVKSVALDNLLKKRFYDIEMS